MKKEKIIFLRPELAAIMKELNTLYKKSGFYGYQTSKDFELAHQEDFKNDHFRDMIQHLIDNGYIESWQSLKPTELGYSYKWYWKKYLELFFLFPALISFAVSVITTLVTQWLKDWL